MSKLLVVVDVQNDFVTGSLGSEQAQAVLPNIIKKVKANHAEISNVTIFTQDDHDKGYLETDEGRALPIPHCIYGTPGQRLVHELDCMTEDIYAVVHKSRFAFNSWKQWLPPYITEIEVIGLVTDICVIANAIMLKTAAPEGVKVVVDASCCAGTSRAMHDKALDIMQGLQIEVINRD